MSEATELDKALDQEISNRDRAERAADALAHKIAMFCGVDIGEHSSANCPWANALNLDLTSYVAKQEG